MNEGIPQQKNQVPTIESLDERNQKLVRLAKKQLVELGPELQNFVATIEKEKPDMVVFLDKGARLFATPIRSYLNENQIPTPEFRFFNDQDLKGSYLGGDEEMDQKIQTDLAPLRGKKILILDETFSVGKGAVSLLNFAEKIGIDASYVALSTDTNSKGQEFSDLAVTLYEHNQSYQRHLKLGKITIGKPKILTVFSKMAAPLYIQEEPDATIRPLLSAPEPTESNIPDARTYADPPEGMSWQEYDEKIRNNNYQTIRKLKDLILKSLEKQPEIKNQE